MHPPPSQPPSPKYLSICHGYPAPFSMHHTTTHLLTPMLRSTVQTVPRTRRT
jgi:hypothetical protein